MPDSFESAVSSEEPRVFDPEDPRAPNGPSAVGFFVNHCEDLGFDEFDRYTARCPICPAGWGSRFWYPSDREDLPDVLDCECTGGLHQMHQIIDFVLSDWNVRKAEAEARRQAELRELSRHYRELRSYPGEDGKLVIEWYDPQERRDPGADDDDPTPVAAAALPAANERKSGPTRLSELLFTPSYESLRTTPPRRRFLLTVPGDGTGVFPAGKVGVLAAPGGGGKSFTLMQLAVAVASSTTAFGDGRGWKAEGGRVLFLLGEEDREEAERRLYHAVAASGLTSEDDLDLLTRNLDLMPLCGQPVALTTSLDSELAVLPETQRCVELREIVTAAKAEGRPYSLIILDPLSRFAGTDVEVDNAAATRFVQVLESLTAVEYGQPSLIISAHERKKQRDDDPESADPIRGSSALKDAFRWAARLEQRKRKENAPDLLHLRVVKTNLTKPGLKLVLCRPPDWHGALRVATDDEVEAYEQSTAKGTRESSVALPDLVLAELARGPASGNELADERLHIHRGKVNIACSQLATDGRIVRQGKKWALGNAAPGSLA